MESGYTPIQLALETCRLKDQQGKSSSRISRSTSDKDRSTELISKSSLSDVQESHSKIHSNSDLETNRIENHHQSSEKTSSLNRKFSSTPSKSHSPSQKSYHNSGSDNKSHNISIYITPEGTPFSKRLKEAEDVSKCPSNSDCDI